MMVRQGVRCDINKATKQWGITNRKTIPMLDETTILRAPHVVASNAQCSRALRSTVWSTANLDLAGKYVRVISSGFMFMIQHELPPALGKVMMPTEKRRNEKGGWHEACGSVTACELPQLRATLREGRLGPGTYPTGAKSIALAQCPNWQLPSSVPGPAHRIAAHVAPLAPLPPLPPPLPQSSIIMRVVINHVQITPAIITSSPELSPSAPHAPCCRITMSNVSPPSNGFGPPILTNDLGPQIRQKCPGAPLVWCHALGTASLG